MSRKFPEKLRTKVNDQAGYRCEYCRVHQDDRGLTFPLDHIISVKHGGLTDEMNLALSCPECNRNKGSDLGSFIEGEPELIRFFNPRTDTWSEHFEIENGVIHPLTPIGVVTARVFKFNHPDRIIFRQSLMELGRYP